jgi:hypothetical protein
MSKENIKKTNKMKGLLILGFCFVAFTSQAQWNNNGSPDMRFKENQTETNYVQRQFEAQQKEQERAQRERDRQQREYEEEQRRQAQEQRRQEAERRRFEAEQRRLYSRN